MKQTMGRGNLSLALLRGKKYHMHSRYIGLYKVSRGREWREELNIRLEQKRNR